MPIATITSKGQVTIPGEIRKKLKLKSGDKIDFVVGEQGEVLVRPASIDVSELRGALKPTANRHLSVEEMAAAIRKRFSGSGAKS